jgi:protocatechuate 3,4-dioxygenase beta subunit
MSVGPEDRAMTTTPPPEDRPPPSFEPATFVDRRRMLQLVGGAGLLALVGCASNGTRSSATTSASGPIGEVPEETAGPFPGDGSNAVNVLTERGVVRQDIRSSFGSSSGTAEGVTSTIAFTVVDASTGAPVPGAAVYVWHCDREGRYSLYSHGATDQNYLRGVQETGADGVASFTSIYPACYAGRWPHIHFEVYPSLDEATAAGTPIATSQIALPQDVSEAVYATDGYEQSVRNLSQVSLSSDMVFQDGVELETPTVTGSVDQGYAMGLKVGVAA